MDEEPVRLWVDVPNGERLTLEWLADRFASRPMSPWMEEYDGPAGAAAHLVERHLPQQPGRCVAAELSLLGTSNSTEQRWVPCNSVTHLHADLCPAHGGPANPYAETIRARAKAKREAERVERERERARHARRTQQRGPVAHALRPDEVIAMTYRQVKIMAMVADDCALLR
jgi:hypothetical protein